jgi:hypothetical protein
MSRQHPDFDQLDDELHSLFARATDHIDPQRDLVASVQQRLAQGESVQSAGAHRSRSIAATLSVFIVVALLVGVLAELRGAGAQRGGPNGTGAPAATAATATTVATTVPFTVTRVDLAVTPGNIAGNACGSVATFTYTATFHIPAQTAGGSIHFGYTLNNGRSQTPGAVTVAPGATSATYTFTSAGVLPADHTYPAPAEVMVTSPNSVLSPSALPSGSCVAQSSTGATGPFQVTSVAMAVSPTSIAGKHCGTSLTVTYTATFHLAANGPGGTIRFADTVNNGRGSTPASVAVAPGQTTVSYSFQWSGALPADHTYPEAGGVIVQSPNAVNSSLLGPSGACS